MGPEDQHVLAELRSLPPDRRFTVKGDGTAMMRCPWHGGGQERTPSLSILLTPKGEVPAGSFHCFGCNAHGGFNKLAKELGLVPLTRRSAAQSTASALMQWEDASQPAKQEDSGVFAWPTTQAWRGISGDVLAKFNASMVSYGSGFFLRLPVTLYGERMGHVDCKLEKPTDGSSSYINSRNKLTSRCLLGFDQALAYRRRHRNTPVWIVEGPRDCLSVWQAKRPAVALLGASSITDAKVALLDELAPSVYVIATDSDEAGDSSAAVLRERLGARHTLRRYVFKKRGMDPADLTPKAIRQISRKVLESLETGSARVQSRSASA